MKGYRIISELAEGGFGRLRLAQRAGSGTLSVIKTLHHHLAHDRTARGRFLREAQVGALLEHRNIARMLDAWFEDQALSIAYELVEGQNLEAITMKRSMPRELGVTIMLQVLDGLHHAHELRGSDGAKLGLVHRDLSPKNVVVGYAGEVKLIDFGIVRAPVGDFRTTPGMLVGTLRYLSPEQATGIEVDRRSDVYSAGAMLFELLAGRPLIPASDMNAIFRAIAFDAPPPVMQELDAVIARALEKDRDRRFATALEMRRAIEAAVPSLADLREAELGRFVSSLFPRAKSDLEKKLARARVSEPAAEPTRVAISQPKRSKSGLLAGVLAAIAVCGLAAVQLSQRREPPPNVAPKDVPIARERPQPPSAKQIPAPDEPRVPATSVVRARPPPTPQKTALRSAPQPAVDATIRALRQQLELAGSDPIRLFDLSDAIKREAASIGDEATRSLVRAKAHSSAHAGDLNGLASAIDQLERARAR